MTFSDFALTGAWDRTELSSCSTLVGLRVCLIAQPHAIIALNGTIGLLCMACISSQVKIMPHKILDQKLVLRETYREFFLCSTRFRLGYHSGRRCLGRGVEVPKIPDSSMSGQTELCFVTRSGRTSKDGPYPIPEFPGRCSTETPGNCSGSATRNSG
jgi:hypothetical protein